MLKSFFESEKIEYFAVLPYEKCVETKGYLAKKTGFAPKSVIIYLLPYYVSRGENLSAYATSLDYHIAIEKINEGLINYLKSAYPCNNFCGYGDHSPIDERHAALISGLGISGKNGLLINEKYGSYVFIGDVISDIEPSLLSSVELYEIKSCENCGACLKACPTGVLRAEGCGCLSAITQKKGALSKDEEELILKFNTVWGCDLCQNACPHNKKPKKTPLKFFHKDRLTVLTKSTLDSLSDSSFSTRAFAWRGRAVLERNLELFKDEK